MPQTEQKQTRGLGNVRGLRDHFHWGMEAGPHRGSNVEMKTLWKTRYSRTQGKKHLQQTQHKYAIHYGRQPATPLYYRTDPGLWFLVHTCSSQPSSHPGMATKDMHLLLVKAAKKWLCIPQALTTLLLPRVAER